LKRILLVGQGLAGSALSYTLYRKEIPFVVFDSGNKASSSRIAAGLINPIVFKRLNTVHKATECLAAAGELYRFAESLSGSRFYHTLPLYKPWSEDARQMFIKKSLGLQAFMDDELLHNPYPGIWKPLQEYVKVKGAYVITPDYLDATSEWLSRTGRLRTASFDVSDLNTEGEQIRYQGEEFSDLVFCSGYQKNHPFFDEPFSNPVKGEVLTLQMKNYPTEAVLTDEQYIVPAKEGRFKLGSTYDWDQLDNQPTEAAKKVLEDKFRELISLPYTVVEHRAGVRPSTDDRSPVLGKSVTHPHVWIMNGLGTRGALLAPYLSEILAEALAGGKPIPAEFDIARFRYTHG